MMHVIIRTGSGRKFARRIGQELKRINRRNFWIMPSVSYFPTSFERRPRLNPRNTLIHSRAAYPDCSWVRNLIRKEEEGFRVINTTDVLRLTSNKLLCAEKMYDAGLPHPKTFRTNKTTYIENLGEIWDRMEWRHGGHKVIVKPYTSMEQGASVRAVTNYTEFVDAIRSMPTAPVVVQEYVPYTAIYRIIVIGGEALPISWRDVPSPSRWRVSVCLNRNMGFVRTPDRELLRLAERTQRTIGGEINFIDVFETRDGYVLSEINTACNLLIHEEKARQAGSNYWNIARYIALYLDREARRM